MSAMAQIERRVREIVEAVVSALHASEKAQDDRLDDHERRLKEIEDRLSPTSARAARPRAAQAKAGTATAAGEASDTA